MPHVHSAHYAECEAVPVERVASDKCWWPPYHQPIHTQRAIRHQEAPDPSTWLLSDARVPGSAGASLSADLAYAFGRAFLD